MKNVITVVCLFFAFSNLSAQTKKTTSSGPNYKTLSINYVASRLRSPGSAQLVEYAGVVDSKKLLIDAGFKLSECTKVTRVVVDSQNGFGALIRGFYFVFFKNGKPCHIEDAANLHNVAGKEYMTDVLNIALNMNNCDCSK
jgi:hypothetical protein